MYLFKSLAVALLASSGVTAQVTLDPSTIKTGRTSVTIPVFGTKTETVTVTASATTTKTEKLPASTSIFTVIKTTTSITTVKQVSTVTSIATYISVSTKPCGPSVVCPTITSTATACATCLVPQCTTTEQLTRPCGCSAALPTQVVSFPCNKPDSCGLIGCKTVYAIKTAAC
ncbi:hypothetical protein B0T17DRAFT_606640 [Bombardia bombarda]|uniref:Uncharacterized protein n=1 Tax=Bombardia bombarda TaxID=252184 RepID=A0AA39X8M7_9PEZI|nr:hypothetical protein B0T17DRAFT_606640 [Bombardia bombarda]